MRELILHVVLGSGWLFIAGVGYLAHNGVDLL